MNYGRPAAIDAPPTQHHSVGEFGRAEPTKPLWLRRILIVALVPMPLGLLFAVRSEHLAGACLAYLNTLIVVWAVVRLLSRRTLAAIVPVTMLTWLTIGWPVTTVLLAMLAPDAGYGRRGAHVALLAGSVKLQLVIMLFLLIYLPITFVSLRHGPVSAPTPSASGRRLGIVVLYYFSFTSVFFLLTKVAGLPGGELASRLFLYSVCLPLVVGANAEYLHRAEKLYLVVLFLLLLFVFGVATTRRHAVVPIIAFSFGYWFLSGATGRAKTALMVLVVSAFPAYLVIGNVARQITGESGYENFADRVDAVRQWRSVTAGESWSGKTLGRLFFTGGHSVIVFTPSERPFLGFDGPHFALEAAMSLVPGFISDHMAFRIAARYTGNFILNSYGFHLTEKHQVGVTLLGSFWLLGGYPWIAVGAILVAALQALTVWIINCAQRTSSGKALFLLAFMMPAYLWMPGRGFIVNFRDLFWQTILAFVCYHLIIRPYTERLERTELGLR